MTIPYVQKQYYWIPRLWGHDQETGTYAQYGAGGWQWISVPDPGTPEFYSPAPGLQQRALYLPSWFPRQAYLSGIEGALMTSEVPTSYGEFAGWVDPGGHFFHSAVPNGAEAGSNFTDSISLFHVTMTGSQTRWHRDFHTPILLDRDAGDLIGLKAGFPVGSMTVFVGFRFLVEA